MILYLELDPLDQEILRSALAGKIEHDAEWAKVAQGGSLTMINQHLDRTEKLLQCLSTSSSAPSAAKSMR